MFGSFAFVFKTHFQFLIIVLNTFITVIIEKQAIRQVATNDLIILIAFIPIVKFLLGVSNIAVPWDTLILSVVVFVVALPYRRGRLLLNCSKQTPLPYMELRQVKQPPRDILLLNRV